MRHANDTSSRNREILRLRESGMALRKLAEKYQRSARRIAEIVDREKEKRDRYTLPGMGMRIFNLVRRAMKMDRPTLEEFGRFVQKEGWRESCLRVRGCGPGRLAEIEDYAGKNNLLAES